MQKGNSKPGNNGKSIRKKSTGKTDYKNASAGSVKIQVDLDPVGNGDGGKQKQPKAGEKRIAKKLNFEEYQEKNKKRKNAKGDNGQKPQQVKMPSKLNNNDGEKEIQPRMTQVHYEEDGDEVIFEVEDNTLDFETEMDASQIIERYERSDPKDDDEDSEEEQHDNSQGSRNNNASQSEEKGINYDGPGTSQGQGTQKSNHSEEEGMQRFVDYIRKQGLVIVDASKVQNEMPKFDKRREMGGMNTQRNKKLTVRREKYKMFWGVIMSLRLLFIKLQYKRSIKCK